MFFFWNIQSVFSQYNFKAFPMDEKDQVVYVYDPLCGWCYGFSNVISQLQENYQLKIGFSVLSGGMMTGSREEPISVMADYIKGAYKTVEEKCGVKFGEPYLKGILDSKTYISSSVLPSIALSVFKSIAPENKHIGFAKMIQRTFYLEGKSLNDPETYKPLVESMGVDTVIFMQRLEEDAFKKITEQEFDLVSKMGITGFPTVFVVKGGKGYLLSNGYVDYASISKNLDRILAM